MKSVTLTDEQRQAVAAIDEFMSNGQGERCFVLHGLAGTGKTTVLCRVARDNPDALLCTLTGKAASILRRKSGLDACTVHSLFYKLVDIVKGKNGKRDLRWSHVHDENEIKDKIVLLDECSMINEDIARDILRTGAKIVACGDPGQLPPVSGQAFFTKPSFELKTIHRQALESPIIRQAHAVRNGGQYATDGNGFRVTSNASDQEVLSADVILCWTNKTRSAANDEARRVRGLWMPFPQAGEPVVCFRNAKDYGIFNGAVYTLLRNFVAGDKEITIDVDGEQVTIPNVYFEGIPSSLPDNEDATTHFGFGYAMTVHKAQGSEWPSVILLDEYKRPDRATWLYTGITRASDNLLVIR